MKQMKTEGKEMPVSADLVFFNGKIAKVDRKFGFCTAIAVKDGWIIDIGRMKGSRKDRRSFLCKGERERTDVIR